MTGLLRSTAAPRCLFVELHPAFLGAFQSSVAECVYLMESSGYTRAYWQTRADQIHCIYRRGTDIPGPGAMPGSRG